MNLKYNIFALRLRSAPGKFIRGLRSATNPFNCLKSPVFYKIILVIFFIGLCSCNNNKKETANTKTKLKVIHWFVNDKYRWEEAIKEFEKMHPDIEVDLELAVYSLYVQKLMTSTISGKSTGDVLILEDWFAQDLLERNYFINLNDFVKKELDTSLLFMRSFEDYTNSKGELIGIPIGLISTVLCYNKDIFDAAGVKYPDSNWTYNDMLEAAKKITRDTNNDGRIDTWGIQINYSPLLDALLYSYGGGVLTNDRSTGYLNSPASIEALRYFIDLYRVHNVAPMPDPANMTMTIPFLTGKFGMAMQPDFKSRFRNLKFRWDFTYIPFGPAGRLSPRFSQAFGIPKNSEKQREALIFLKWFIMDMPDKYANIMESILPVNKKLANSRTYQLDEPKCNRKILLDIQERFSFSYQRPGYFELRDYGFQPEIEKAMSGKISVEEAAQRGNKNINEALKRLKD